MAQHNPKHGLAREFGLMRQLIETWRKSVYLWAFPHPIGMGCVTRYIHCFLQ